jgi:hypothetical protein
MSRQNNLQSRGGGALSTSPETSNHKSQHRHVLDLLMAADGKEVPLADIMVCAAQYNFCIHVLRKRGYKIVNRTETRNGVRHSWYRLESSPENPSLNKPAAATGPSRKKPPNNQPPTPPTAPPQTLSLFPEMSAPATAPERPAWRDPELGGIKNGSVKHG